MTICPEEITKIAKILIEEIEKYYPGLTKKRFCNLGMPDEDGSSAQHRAEFCIYIELVKAGAFDEVNN